MSSRRDPFVVPADCDELGVIRFDEEMIPRAQRKAIIRARFAGQRVELEIRLRKTKRTDRQNRLFWALLTPWAAELGYTPDELKSELLGLLWGYDEATSPLTGEVRLVPKRQSSSRLSTKDFAELVEFMAMKAAETGYVMELPDELRAKPAA